MWIVLQIAGRKSFTQGRNAFLAPQPVCAGGALLCSTALIIIIISIIEVCVLLLLLLLLKLYFVSQTKRAMVHNIMMAIKVTAKSQGYNKQASTKERKTQKTHWKYSKR